MSNKDINIDNYTYPEMLDVFGVGREFKASVIDEMDAKLRKVREKLPVEYYVFYLKVHRIISMVHQLFIKNVIQDELNLRHIEYYVDKIKSVPDFESMNPSDLFNRLGVLAVTNKESSKEKNEQQQQQHYRLSEVINEESKYPSNSSNKLVDPHLLVNSFPYPIAPTNLNSIKRVTQFKNVCFDSTFRHNYYQTSACNYQYTIPSEIKNVVSMRLASLELPNTWYLFSKRSKTNYFIMTVTEYDSFQETDVTTDYRIEIPDGSYDIDTIATYLNTTYFYNSGNTNSLSLFIFVVDENTFKTTIAFYSGVNSTNASFSLCFLDDVNHNMMNTFGWIMGFRLANYYNVTDGYGITSEGMFDAAGDRYLYVAINDYQKNNNALNMVCFDNSIMEEDIIGKIPITTGKLSIIITENNALVKTRRYNGPVNIRNLHIRLMDKFGDILDLNNMDFSFTLEFEILYEKFNFLGGEPKFPYADI
jgi:hypothetical protein